MQSSVSSRGGDSVEVAQAVGTVPDLTLDAELDYFCVAADRSKVGGVITADVVERSASELIGVELTAFIAT